METVITKHPSERPKSFNIFRPLKIMITTKTNNNTNELPFGWGEGEPPTPDDEVAKFDTKQSKK